MSWRHEGKEGWRRGVREERKEKERLKGEKKMRTRRGGRAGREEGREVHISFLVSKNHFLGHKVEFP